MPDVAEIEAAVRVREVQLRAREAALLPPLTDIAAAHGVSMAIAEQRQTVRVPCLNVYHLGRYVETWNSSSECHLTSSRARHDVKRHSTSVPGEIPS